MGIHCMVVFVTIGNLVSPSSSLNGEPLDDFPDHWQPRFSIEFPLRRTSAGADLTRPSERKNCPLSVARESRAVN